jgi:hypothetical protein
MAQVPQGAAVETLRAVWARNYERDGQICTGKSIEICR